MNTSKNNFRFNKQSFLFGIYVVMIVSVCAVIIKAIRNLNGSIALFNSLLSALAPFLVGFLIAFFLNPVVSFIEFSFFKNVCKIKKGTIRRTLAMLISYIIILGLITGLLTYVIPHLVTSINGLVVIVQNFYQMIPDYMSLLEEKFPDVDLNYFYDTVNTALPSFVNILNDFVTDWVPKLYNTSVSVIKWVYNIVIAILVSCYMLVDKEKLLRSMKRIIYALFSKENSDKLCIILARVNQIFKSFIVGKTIDSLIIGILCFILMCILKLPYPLLISLIVGITNMIPYFGPFIGAVPGAIILFIISPKQCLIYLILILALQQFDGWILGPKILGDVTGLRPIWVIFAISIGGWVYGPIGMFLGVPCVGVVSYLVDLFVNARLGKKKIDLPSLNPNKASQNKWTIASLVNKFNSKNSEE